MVRVGQTVSHLTKRQPPLTTLGFLCFPHFQGSHLAARRPLPQLLYASTEETRLGRGTDLPEQPLNLIRAGATSIRRICAIDSEEAVNAGIFASHSFA